MCVCVCDKTKEWQALLSPTHTLALCIHSALSLYLVQCDPQEILLLLLGIQTPSACHHLATRATSSSSSSNGHWLQVPGAPSSSPHQCVTKHLNCHQSSWQLFTDHLTYFYCLVAISPSGIHWNWTPYHNISIYIPYLQIIRSHAHICVSILGEIHMNRWRWHAHTQAHTRRPT